MHFGQFGVLKFFLFFSKCEKAEHNKKMMEMIERFFTSIFLKMFFIQGNAIQHKRFGVFCRFLGGFVLLLWVWGFFGLVLFFPWETEIFSVRKQL